MEFSFTDEHLDIQQKIRDYCQRVLVPGAAELDAAPPDQTLDMIRNRLKSLAQEGFLGLAFPTEAGGSGKDLLCTVILFQELGEACPATALAAISSVGLCARAIHEWGTKEQKDQYLEKLLSGEMVGAYGSLEPEASLDGWELETVASAAGNSFKLKGQKRMVLNAPLGGVKVISATAEGTAGLFLVAQDASGLEVSPPQDKLGCRGVPTSDLTLNDCTAIKLAPEDGTDAVTAIRCYEHLLFGAMATGMLNAAMVTAGVHARDHLAGGKPLARHQEISFKLADSLVFQETSLMLLHRTVWMINEKNAEAPVLASSAKVFASEAAVKAANWAVQITGQQGYRKGSLAERIYRDTKLVEILGDAIETHRMFIADKVLSEY